MRVLDVPASKLHKGSDATPSSTSSVRDFKQAAKSAGLIAIATKFSDAEQRIQFPSLWHKTNGESLLVVWSSDEGPEVFCYDAKGYWTTRDEIRKNITGNGLILSNPLPDRPARLWIDSDQIDVGRLEGIKDDYREITIINAGGKPLLITGASFSCNCAKIQLPPGPVNPGECVIMPLVINSSVKSNGPFKLSLFLKSNTPEGVHHVTLTGEVKRGIIVTPNYHSLSTIYADEQPRELKYTIDFGSDTTVEPAPPAVSKQELKWISARRLDSGLHELVVQLCPANILPRSDGTFFVYTDIDANHARFKKVRLGVVGKIRNRIEVYPKEILFTKYQSDTKMPQIVHVSNNTGIAQLEIATTGEAFTAELDGDRVKVLCDEAESLADPHGTLKVSAGKYYAEVPITVYRQ